MSKQPKATAKKKSTSKNPDYDNLDPRERAFALFTACEEARSEALEKGASYEDAHDAALAAWNAWVEPLLEERKQLEAEGIWEIEQNTDKINSFSHRTRLDASSFIFLDPNHTTSKLDNEPETHELDEGKLSGSKFSKILLCQTVSFNRFCFPGYISFKNTQFLGDAAFDIVQFSDHVSFENTIFQGFVVFDSTQFNDSTYFNNAHFEGVATFNDVHFKGNASFDNVNFKDDAFFVMLHFKDSAYFIDTHFKKDAYFNETHFKSDVFFNNTTFKGNADFSSAQFKGDAGFNLSIFMGTTSFYSSKFHAGADFTAITGESAFSLNGAGFSSAVPYFTQSNFKEIPRLDDISLALPQIGAKEIHKRSDKLFSTDWHLEKGALQQENIYQIEKLERLEAVT